MYYGVVAKLSELLPNQTKNHTHKKKKGIKIGNIVTDQDEVDAQSLETLDDLGLGWVRESGFSNQSKGWVTGFRAGFDEVFSNEAGASDNENLGFGFCHWSRE